MFLRKFVHIRGERRRLFLHTSRDSADLQARARRAEAHVALLLQDASRQSCPPQWQVYWLLGQACLRRPERNMGKACRRESATSSALKSVRQDTAPKRKEDVLTVLDSVMLQNDLHRTFKFSTQEKDICEPEWDILSRSPTQPSPSLPLT